MAMLNCSSTSEKSSYTYKVLPYIYEKVSHTYQGWHILLASLFLVGCGVGPSSGNTPEEMFEAVLQKPIPASVTQLQGVGDTWQGYQLFLRFRAAETEIESLIQTGYEAVDCAAISLKFRLPDQTYHRFDPPWRPQNVATKECYAANEVTNSWTGSGTHHLIIDRQQKLVYFTGIGI